jgi:hypothetical protein
MNVKDKKDGTIYKVLGSLYIENKYVYKLLNSKTNNYVYLPKNRVKKVSKEKKDTL